MRRTLPLLTGLLALVLGGCYTPPTSQMIREADLHRDLADVKLGKRELGYAIREYQAALSLNPLDPETHFGLAEAYRHKKLYDLAEQHYRKAIEIDPYHPHAQLNLGVIFMKQERWQDAIDINTRLIAEPLFLRPERALVNRGWAHYKFGNLEAAESDLRQALEGSRGPREHAHLDLGIVLYEKGEILEAVVSFERVLDLIEGQPRDFFAGIEAQSRYLLARAYVRLGQHGRAMEHLRAAAEVGGETEWGRRSREYLVVLE